MQNGEVYQFNIDDDKKKRAKNILLILLIIFLLGIGYAILQAVLKISGTTTVARNTWDIHFVEESTDLIANDGVNISNASFESDLSLSFDVSFLEPGSYAECTIDVINNGTIDAMIENFSIEVDGEDDIPPYLIFDVKYSDDFVLAEKQILRAGTSETFKIRIGYNKDINSSQLPDEQVSHDLYFAINYVQADRTAIEIRNFKYSFFTTALTIGQVIPSGVDLYTDASRMISDYHVPIGIKHVVQNDIIMNSGLYFFYNDTPHSYPYRSDFFETYSAEIYSVFSNVNGCSYNGDHDTMTCVVTDSDTNNMDLYVEISANNVIFIASQAENDVYACYLCNGKSICGDYHNMVNINTFCS
ncbi:MAG: hypothetical protein IKF71_01430 [Bacilli bacterium]|nr:hypothetical protein [Bacilli bacterium]